MPQSKPRVVILGAGFGGLEATKTLGRAPVEITLIDRQNYHCFQPLLYQIATAALSPANIAWPIRHILRRGGFFRSGTPSPKSRARHPSFPFHFGSRSCIIGSGGIAAMYEIAAY